jgi:transposase
MAEFDHYAERICRNITPTKWARPSLVPGVYFRCFLIGYFEGIDSERGLAYPIADSVSLREFLGIAIDERTPDHFTLSKTRRKINLSTHKAVFTWGLKRVAAE